jgi:RND family efflux transporter MFP subunit
MNRKYLLAIIAGILIASVLLFFFLRPKGTGGQSGELFTVAERQVTNYTEQTGILKPQVGAIVKVGTRATGSLIFLKYQVGDFARQGELIARIDNREVLANMRTAEAAVDEKRRDLQAKEATYRYAEVNYDRNRRLHDRELVARDELDKARTELDVARANVTLTKAQLAQAEERVRALKISEGYTRIYAPISGYVSAVTTQQGETVVAGLAAVNLITILDPTRLEMWIYVDETDVGRVKPGLPVEYRVDAYRDRKFPGKIAMISPEPEVIENIVYYLAIVRLTPEDALVLKPEMTTHVRIIIDEKTNVLVVPNAAVRFEEGRNVVYLRLNGREERRAVETGIRDDTYTEIRSGLAAGDRVVVPTLRMPSQEKEAPQKRPPAAGPRK